MNHYSDGIQKTSKYDSYIWEAKSNESLAISDNTFPFKLLFQPNGGVQVLFNDLNSCNSTIPALPDICLALLFLAFMPRVSNLQNTCSCAHMRVHGTDIAYIVRG